MPDANWPALPNYAEFTPADHAAHRSPRGIPYPADMPGMKKDAVKATKQLFKITKPHLKFNRLKTKPRKKKKP